MQANARASTGARNTFFINCRWLVLSLLFLKLHPERGEALALTQAEVAALSQRAIEIADDLWTICEAKGFVVRRVGATAGPTTHDEARHFRSIFSSITDCRQLHSAYLAKAPQENPAAPSSGPTPTLRSAALDNE